MALASIWRESSHTTAIAFTRNGRHMECACYFISGKRRHRGHPGVNPRLSVRRKDSPATLGDGVAGWLVSHPAFINRLGGQLIACVSGKAKAVRRVAEAAVQTLPFGHCPNRPAPIAEFTVAD